MVVTDLDHMGLQSLIERWADEESADRRLLVILENKLSKARVVKSKDIPSHTVTMNSKVRLKKKMTDINELLHQVVINFALQINNKNGQITEAYDAENANVEVDPVHFTNLISNLVDNAIKYSGDDPQVGIMTFNKNGKLCIRVRDNGIGIKKEDQKRVFEKFYRVPTGNVHTVKGFGLGLSYVKKIVEEHNGSVSLRSELNKGTEFEISLPINSQ